MCTTCDNHLCHVHIASAKLEGMSGDELLELLIDCSHIKPIHVLKGVTALFALIHFEDEAVAAAFHYLYGARNIVLLLCSRLGSYRVKPSMINRVHVEYDYSGVIFLVQVLGSFSRNYQVL